LVARPDGKARPRFSWPLLLTTTNRHQNNFPFNLSWPATPVRAKRGRSVNFVRAIQLGTSQHSQEKNAAKPAN
jgi:hypothetical protein